MSQPLASRSIVLILGLAAERRRDGVELTGGVGRARLGEDGADRGGHLRLSFGHLCQHVAQEVHMDERCQAALSSTLAIPFFSRPWAPDH